jgi:hypothetical protein
MIMGFQSSVRISIFLIVHKLKFLFAVSSLPCPDGGGTFVAQFFNLGQHCIRPETELLTNCIPLSDCWVDGPPMAANISLNP